MSKPAILKTCVFQLAECNDWLEEHFEVHDLPRGEEDREALLDRVGPRIRGIATNSLGPVTHAMLEKLPALEIVSSWSAGREGIDVDALMRRNIKFFDTSAILASDVADLAFALLISSLRGIVGGDRHVRAGLWPTRRFLPTTRLSGKRVGIVGLGLIGNEVAKRSAAFGMEIGYYGPRRKVDVPYAYFPTPTALAEWCDVMVLSCVGGPATRHLVNSQVLAALGQDGWLINVARGSVVDEQALIDALANGRIAGAGLDVYQDEPNVPQGLIASERTVLMPHHGSSTRETKYMQGTSLFGRLAEHFGVANT